MLFFLEAEDSSELPDIRGSEFFSDVQIKTIDIPDDDDLFDFLKDKSTEDNNREKETIEDEDMVLYIV